jgi:hypothetical protein
MRPKPSKGTVARLPFRQPPDPATLERGGLELMRTKRAAEREDAVAARARAEQMPWAGRLTDASPWQSRGWWLWLVTKEAA